MKVYIVEWNQALGEYILIDIIEARDYAEIQKAMRKIVEEEERQGWKCEKENDDYKCWGCDEDYCFMKIIFYEIE